MTCDDYFEDPEKNAAHLESCAECRAMTEELDEPIEVQHRPMQMDALPMAPWEGATHRTWPLVAAGAAAVAILAMVLFLAAGTPPLRGIAHAVASSFSLEGATKFFHYLGPGLHGAPAIIHVTIAVLFVTINAILFLLLRRAPKGLDV
jgi:hypothetical protein